MKLTKLEKEYNRIYGHLPDDEDLLVAYVSEKYPVKQEALERAIDRIKNMEWKRVHLYLPLIPQPAPRPRSCGDHFYVKGAREHKKAVQNIIDVYEIIFTKVKIYIDIYQPIPTASMTNTEINLAQLGWVDPISGGDWDNFAKTYCDSIQNYFITNDNIIVDGNCSKHYSIKPHVEIHIEYANDFDCKYNERKVKRSKDYQRLVEGKDV